MPNHIKNKIELIGSLEDIDLMIKKFSTYHAAIINKTHDDQEYICMNRTEQLSVCWFNPKTGKSKDRGSMDQYGIPEGFEIEIKDSFIMFPDFAKVIPPPDCPEYRDEPSQYAVKNSPNWWYTWNIENWGSKWGGYCYERPSIATFVFETAWAPCPIIIESMSEQFPNVKIVYKWADEDTGHNCGESIYRGGLISECKPKGNSKEAYEIAFELRPDRRENYELVGDSYKYKEED